MILTERWKTLLIRTAIFAGGLALGSGAGWVFGGLSAVAENNAKPIEHVVAETTESTTILPAPIPPTYKLTIRRGQGLTHNSEGRAIGAGVQSDNADLAAKVVSDSGTPTYAPPPNSPVGVAPKGGGGSFDITAMMGSRGNVVMLIAGILILCGTGYAVYSLFPVSRKQAALAGGIGLALGGILIVGGTNAALFNQCVLAALGIAMVGGLVYAWHMGVFAKAAGRAFAYDKLADFYWDHIISESPDATAMKEKTERIAPTLGLVEAHNSLL